MQFSGCSNFAALIIGPPGVGKTSIGSIVSECCDKPLVYIDCSGADVIGMSGLVKSYSGAKAGKVIDGLWEIGRTDAVVLFDEIDKLSVTKEGNPYSVFLKALGPQKLLHDEYVDEDIDVSSSIFIATALFIILEKRNLGKPKKTKKIYKDDYEEKQVKGVNC